MKFFVYILECADKTLYVGCTNNLERRLGQHNGSQRGAHYTKIRRPVTLQYLDFFGQNPLHSVQGGIAADKVQYVCMTRTNIETHDGIWYWYHNISECYYHIQITVKYGKPLLDEAAQKIMLMAMSGFKECFALDIHTVGFDQNHVHLLCRFFPKYSGGQVVSLIKSITASHIFKFVPSVKKELWGGEFWTDGYYIATISGKGNRAVIERYIRNQGRTHDVNQLTLFNLGHALRSAQGRGQL